MLYHLRDANPCGMDHQVAHRHPRATRPMGFTHDFATMYIICIDPPLHQTMGHRTRQDTSRNRLAHISQSIRIIPRSYRPSWVGELDLGVVATSTERVAGSHGVFSMSNGITDRVCHHPRCVQASELLNSWTRWGIVMSYSFVSQICQSVVSATLGAWMSSQRSQNRVQRAIHSYLYGDSSLHYIWMDD